MNTGFIAWVVVGGIAGVALAIHVFRRLRAELCTIRARAWVPSLSRALSRWVNAADYAGDAFFSADGADPRVVRRRSEALDCLAASLGAAHAKSAEWSASVHEGFS